ncbi:MAG TPA: hypothetical protein VH164_01040 [Ktedonobacteraceae bacterium]|jgi:hypothetical protein|nr:hypothetical protein [Ktedonobacteraceae bacterium]
MATNQTITGLRFMRLRDAHGYMGRALSACVHQPLLCANTRFAPVTGLAQGRIVSISRGSPPHKLR